MYISVFNRICQRERKWKDRRKSRNEMAKRLNIFIVTKRRRKENRGRGGEEETEVLPIGRSIRNVCLEKDN